MSFDEMVLVDTSLWADHLNYRIARMEALLDEGLVLMHPHVTGELAMGNLSKREVALRDLKQLPEALAADDDEVLRFVARHKLYGRGIGWVDAHLLASVALSFGSRIWTRDRRLGEAAEELDLHFKP